MLLDVKIFNMILFDFQCDRDVNIVRILRGHNGCVIVGFCMLIQGKFTYCNLVLCHCLSRLPLFACFVKHTVIIALRLDKNSKLHY